jgi:hypothetical protein
MTATHDCTCLGHLGQCYQNKNDPISVATLKVAKASAHMCHCCWRYLTLNSANGITALITIWDMLKLCEDTLNVTSAEFLDLGKEL